MIYIESLFNASHGVYEVTISHVTDDSEDWENNVMTLFISKDEVKANSFMTQLSNILRNGGTEVSAV